MGTTIELGTVYELNQQIMQQSSPLNEQEREAVERIFSNYLTTNYLMNHKYFILLNNEKKDYTVFAIHKKFDKELLIKDLFECIDNRGALKEVTYTEDSFGLEIWIEAAVYYFFPYDEGVLEY